MVAELLIPQVEYAWGIKVPDREPWENKIVQRRKYFMATKKKAAKKKKH